MPARKVTTARCHARNVTEVGEDGKKHATITIHYRFPGADANGVPVDFTGTGSSQNYTNLKRVVYV